jgi:hypothetical protein
MSTNPTGTWLDCLRTSFEPEVEEKRPPKLADAVLGGRLQSA